MSGALTIVTDYPDRMGRVLTPACKGLLAVELRKAGINLDHCGVVPVLRSRPDDEKDEPKLADAAAPGVCRTLAEASDGPLLLLGALATRAVLGITKPSTARGFVWRCAAPTEAHLKSRKQLEKDTARARALIAGRWAIPTLALNFVLQADSWAPVFRRDIARMGRVVAAVAAGHEPKLEQGGAPSTTGSVASLALEGWDPSEVTCDIETDGIDPQTCAIRCIGLTDIATGETRVLWPWDDTEGRLLAAWLRVRKRVVFHNGFNFDVLVMRAHGIEW